MHAMDNGMGMIHVFMLLPIGPSDHRGLSRYGVGCATPKKKGRGMRLCVDDAVLTPSARIARPAVK